MHCHAANVLEFLYSQIHLPIVGVARRGERMNVVGHTLLGYARYTATSGWGMHAIAFCMQQKTNTCGACNQAAQLRDDFPHLGLVLRGAAGVDEHLGDRDEVQPLQLSADIPVYLDVLYEQGELCIEYAWLTANWKWQLMEAHQCPIHRVGEIDAVELSGLLDQVDPG